VRIASFQDRFDVEGFGHRLRRLGASLAVNTQSKKANEVTTSEKNEFWSTPAAGAMWGGTPENAPVFPNLMVRLGETCPALCV
jgi:hypothetical protein